MRCHKGSIAFVEMVVELGVQLSYKTEIEEETMPNMWRELELWWPLPEGELVGVIFVEGGKLSDPRTWTQAFCLSQNGFKVRRNLGFNVVTRRSHRRLVHAPSRLTLMDASTLDSGCAGRVFLVPMVEYDRCCPKRARLNQNLSGSFNRA